MMREGDKLASYQVLSSALGMLRDRPWQLLVVGDGPARSAVEAALTGFGRGRIDPVVVGGAGELGGVLSDILNDGDLLLMMGAGDIGYAAQHIAAHGFNGASNGERK